MENCYIIFFLGGGVVIKLFFGMIDGQGEKVLYIRGIIYEILEIYKKKIFFMKCGIKVLFFKYNVVF